MFRRGAASRRPPMTPINDASDAPVAAPPQNKKRRTAEDEEAEVADGSQAALPPPPPPPPRLTNPFVGNLAAAGARLSTTADSGEQRFKFRDAEVNQSIFERNLKRLLDDEAEKGNFLRGFGDFVRIEANLQTLLQPPESEFYGAQDSVARCLLHVESVQTDVALELLDQLVAHCRPDGQSQSVASKILGQFRYLESVAESKRLWTKLRAVLSSAHLGALQQDLIRFLPEMLDEQTHAEAGAFLNERYLNDEEAPVEAAVKVAVLEALGHLHLSADTMAAVRESLLSTLGQSPIALRPAAVDFCLDSAAASHADQSPLDVLRAVRDALPLDEAWPQPGRRKANAASVRSDALVQILANLETKIRFRDGVVGKAAGQLVAEITSVKVFDLFLLLLLRQNGGAPKRLRRLANDQLITAHLVDKMFSHTAAVEMRFDALRDLADELMRDRSEAVRLLADWLYQALFRSLHDINFRQFVKETVVSLLVHVGSNDAETTSALRCLRSLVDEFPAEMQSFEIFARNLLEYLQFLNFDHVKQLFTVLFALAESSDDDGDTAADDLNICIGKFSSSLDPRERTWGTIGVLMKVKESLKKMGETERQSPECQKWMDLVASPSSPADSSKVVFLIGLTEILHELNSAGALELLADYAQATIEELHARFSTPLDQCAHADGLAFETAAAYDLRVESLGDEVALDWTRVPSTDATLLAAALRLAGRLLRRATPSLDVELTLRRLFVAPVRLCAEDTLNNLAALEATDRQRVCRMYFLCANYFRELLNAFAQAERGTPYMARFKALFAVERLLLGTLRGVSEFELPLSAAVDSKVTVRGGGKAPVDPNAPKKKRQPRKKKAKSGAEAAEKQEAAENGESDGGGDEDFVPPTQPTQQRHTQQLAATADEIEAGPSTSSAAAGRPAARKARASRRDVTIDADSIHHWLNRLESGAVAKLLRYPFKLDEDGGASDRVLQLNEVEFLLKEVVVLFDSKSVKIAPEPLVLTDADVKSLVKAVSQIMEKCRVHFEEIINAQDGVIDGNDMTSSVSVQAAACLHLCLVFVQLSLKRGDLSVWKRAYVAGRVREGSLGGYLASMGEFVPNMSCADAALSALEEYAKFSEEDFDSQIAEVAENHLKCLWESTKPSSAPYRRFTSHFLSAWLERTPAVRLLGRAVLDGSGDDSLSDDHGSALESFLAGEAVWFENDSKQSTRNKTLNCWTFAVYYKILFETLNRLSARLPSKKQIKGKTADDRRDCLAQWIQAVRVFNFLAPLVCSTAFKKGHSSSTWTTAMRGSGRFLSLLVDAESSSFKFLLECHFQPHSEPILKLISTVQNSTRRMQALCTFIKTKYKGKGAEKLRALSAEVRTSMARFVGVVKAALVGHGCDAAITIGSLRNRTLGGEEIHEDSIEFTVDLESEAATGDAEEGDDDDGDGDSDVLSVNSEGF